MSTIDRKSQFNENLEPLCKLYFSVRTSTSVLQSLALVILQLQTAVPIRPVVTHVTVLLATLIPILTTHVPTSMSAQAQTRVTLKQPVPILSARTHVPVTLATLITWAPKSVLCARMWTNVQLVPIIVALSRIPFATIQWAPLTASAHLATQ